MPIKFANIFANLYYPVVVCKNNQALDIAYMNIKAALLFSPNHSAEESGYQLKQLQLDNILPRKKEEVFYSKIAALGYMENYACAINSFDGQKANYLITANTISLASEHDFIILYFVENLETKNKNGQEAKLAEIVNATFTALDTDSAIKTVLALVGNYINVSRAYIFEEISPDATKNTYEWCAPGIEPMIEHLSCLRKKDYNYDVIVNAGMYITEDINTIESASDREILSKQGIKALALITLYDKNKTIGYVGFDDCTKKRKWTHKEIQFLKSISAILSILVKRRETEGETARTLEIVQIVSDNIDSTIYVSTLDDYTVKFVSQALLRALGKSKHEVIGHKCWQVFQRGNSGPCEFCKIPELRQQMELGNTGGINWEHKNEFNGRTYLLHDKIIKWTDGKYVHLETGTDISSRISYEQELKHIASTDNMTQVYNREWGGKILSERLKEDGCSGCLCFIDMDGLKHINDYLGHDSGDAMLKDTVKIINDHLTDGDFICRWGGDEFLLWFDKDEQHSAETIAKIKMAMNTYNTTNNFSYWLSFSYGIVSVNQETLSNHPSFDTLVTKADELMYKDKMQKRGLLRKRRRTD